MTNEDARPAAQGVSAEASDPRVVAAGRGRVFVVGAVIALLVGAVAWWLARPQAPSAVVSPAASSASGQPQVDDAAASAAVGKPGRLSTGQLERMVAQTEARLAQDPRDASALAMLAHSQEMLGHFAEAAKTYRKLAELLPKDAQVLADYADVLGMANGGRLQGEPEALLARALVADPRNVKALVLAGSVAVERGDTQKALANWRQAKGYASQPELVRQIEAQIAAVAGGAPPAAPASAVATRATGASGAAALAPNGEAKVAGRVWVARELMGVVSPDAVVYVMVRPADGASRMPLALLRKKVKELPASFVLDDSNAMVKGTSLAGLQNVVVVARVSTRGDVSPQAGDLQGVSPPVPVGTANIKLEINEVLK